MIAVQMDKQAEFNALWNYAKSRMQHQSGPRAGYFAWHTDFEGHILDANPASDGEEYFATALFFASHRWGNGQGIYNYSAEANNILNVMLHKEDMNGGVVDGITNMFNREHKQVVFVPEGENAGFTDPSYHLPAFYELWSRWATGWNGQQTADRRFWSAAAKVSREYFQKATHPETGLVPDYAEFDGTPKGPSWNPGAANFRFDAWRTAVNWSVDQAWWGKDSRETALTDKLQSFFQKEGLDNYVNQYTLDGTRLSADRSSGLIASNGAASLATNTVRARQFTQELWKLEPPTGKWRYYDGLLTFMALLHASGNFRIY
ncbi:glycosyl hydrolase family 8 [Deinococcus sp. YIM 77859]|uniref:glycosyl hydrolase family 8 n=1 Tax=Deinococcus sp. YIM 77859 TaxID=1540221 RepID=UPI0018CCFF09|nr:glycosyl hydrolase family 8 [Deinococcus sp. YIM 77859]